MGRLRAQGANSLMGRSILGAYPGDLPPPDEAGSSRGVVDLARRYGYGDWSDEEDGADDYAFGGEGSDDDEDSFMDFSMDEEELGGAKKTRKRRRKSKSSRQQQSGGVSIGFSVGSSSQESPSPTKVSTRRKKSSTSKSSSLAGTEGIRRRLKSSSSRIPSPAMQSLGGITGSRSASKKRTRKTPSTTTTTGRATSATDTIKNDFVEIPKAKTIIRKRKTRRLSPAMSLLNEAKSKANDE
mmetsp:Transcript_804/g.1774  ORF Transcript_804/g.1774 Transcript_804/m.1774 type:complete len:240 (+) Transcript_804:121-840(+)